MSKIRVAINGFGRIGRLATRALLQNDRIEIVGINDLTDAKTLASLFKFDTAHGKFSGSVEHDDQSLTINGNKILLSKEMEPSKLPWKQLNVDTVLESTGKFVKAEEANLHIQAGAKRVVISAPAKGDVKTIVLGVNDSSLTKNDLIVSNASCTTNCLAPMVKVVDDNWGIVSGLMVTVHAYTSDQRLHDAPHKDLRRARAAAQNIVPTTTGAAEAVTKVLPHLAGKLEGYAMRVPVITGSITDFVFTSAKPATKEEINAKFKEAANGNLKGILEYSEDPLVSSDIIGNPHSCIFDSDLTMVMGNLTKIVGWYDNEAGYANRIADLIAFMGN